MYCMTGGLYDNNPLLARSYLLFLQVAVFPEDPLGDDIVGATEELDNLVNLQFTVV